MAQERNLGYASAPDRVGEEPSKEELQRRMEEARESISSTVTEIKDSVAQQVENVKDALDWREHFKKQPVAWSLGALGVGFLTGYGVVALIKGNDDEADDWDEYSTSSPRTHASKPLVSEHQYTERGITDKELDTNGDSGPGLIKRFKESTAFERLSQEAGTIGDRLLNELSTTAQTVVLPALLAKVKNWIGIDLSNKGESRQATPGTQAQSATNKTERNTYEPILERPV